MEAFSEIFAKEESAGRPLHGVIADRNGDPNFGVGELTKANYITLCLRNMNN